MRKKAAAMYLRLSREDDTGGGQSQSIASQKLILSEYAAAQGIEHVRWYIDDGYSGTNFDRPQFARMMEDVEAGLIDWVVTKDFSRLGRNYAGVGQLIDEYFPAKGVRYTSVAEGIDTGLELGSAGDLAPFLSVFNDMYARDISKKVRSALSARKKAGKFIGAAAPYGYKKDENDHNRLVPDSKSAPFVREIFTRYLSCGSLQETARQLTLGGIPTPASYKSAYRTGWMQQAGRWSAQMVRRILVNPTYAGHLTQNWERTISYKVHKRIQMPPEQRITVQNTHEGIVSQAVFDRAQKLLQAKCYSGERIKREHVLSGLVFCADCMSRMTYVSGGAQRYYMACAASRRTGVARRCTSHLIREEQVIHAACDALRGMSAAFSETQIQAWAMESAQHAKENAPREKEAQASGHEAAQALAMLYQDRAAGRIDEAQCRAAAEVLMREQTRAEAHFRCRQRQAAQTDDELMRRACELVQFRTINSTVAAALIDRIHIYENKKIEIMFSFTAPEVMCASEKKAKSV